MRGVERVRGRERVGVFGGKKGVRLEGEGRES